MTNKRILEYKSISQPVEHCNVCKEILRGDNSMVLPYKCSCGVWVYNQQEGCFEIKEISNEQ